MRAGLSPTGHQAVLAAAATGKFAGFAGTHVELRRSGAQRSILETWSDAGTTPASKGSLHCLPAPETGRGTS